MLGTGDARAARRVDARSRRYAGARYPELEDETLARVNRMRADRKLEPLEKNAWGLDLGPGKAQ